MNTALAHIPLNDIERMADAMAQSGLFGMKSPVQAMALMLVAQSEGQHPATIAQDYDVIQGKATRKTHSVLARFQAAGGRVEWHELTAEKADATFAHPAGGSLRMDWTFEQARKAGLTGKDNWKNYPRAMLRARCIAEGVRAVYPAALGGLMVSEEAMDAPLSPEKHMGAADEVSSTAAIGHSKPDNAALTPADWLASVNACTTLEELGKVSKAGAQHFNKQRDREGYEAHAKAVQARGAVLRAEEAKQVTDVDDEFVRGMTRAEGAVHA